MVCPQGETKPSMLAMTRTPLRLTSLALVIVWPVHDVNWLLLQWQQQYLTPVTLPSSPSTCGQGQHASCEMMTSGRTCCTFVCARQQCARVGSEHAGVHVLMTEAHLEVL